MKWVYVVIGLWAILIIIGMVDQFKHQENTHIVHSGVQP